MSLWNAEKLSALCRRKNPEVRAWAMNRMGLLFPDEARKVALSLLEDKETPVLNEVLNFFCDFPDEQSKESLIQFYKKSSGFPAGKAADALTQLGAQELCSLFQEKHESGSEEDPNGYIYSLFAVALLRSVQARKIIETALPYLESFVEKTGPEGERLFFGSALLSGMKVEGLIDFCLDHRDRPEWMRSLLCEIAMTCHADLLHRDLNEEDHEGRSKNKFPYYVRNALDMIASSGYPSQGRRLEKLFKKKKHKALVKEVYAETERLMAGERALYATTDLLIWEQRQGTPLKSVQAIRSFHKAMESFPETQEAILAGTSLAIFAVLVECRGLIGFNIEEAGRDRLLELFLDCRIDVEEDEKLIELLTEISKEDRSVIEVCTHRLHSLPGSLEAPRIVRLLGRLKEVNSLEPLLDSDIDNEAVWDGMVSALKQAGPDSLDLVKSMFEKGDPERANHALDVLYDLPYDGAADLLLKYWDRLLMNNKRAFLDALQGIGDRRFIEPLGKELMPGEVFEAEVFCLLCEIHGVSNPLVKKTKKELRRYRKEIADNVKDFSGTQPEKILVKKLPVELRCRSCRRAYHYEIEQMVMDQRFMTPLIFDPIFCKHCNAFDDYEITEAGRIAILLHLSLLSEFYKRDEPLPEDATVTFGELSPIEGKSMSLDEALSHYEKKLKKNPQNPEYLIAYANTLRTAKRTSESLERYQEALRYDPNAIEAYVSLGDIAENCGDLKSAHNNYFEASEKLETANLYRVKSDADKFKEILLDNLMDIENRLGMVNRYDQEKSVSAPVQSKKIRRNEPCPCGSGKKYKKCCLNKTSDNHDIVRPLSEQRERALFERLMSHAGSNRYREEFLRASALYWGTQPVAPLVLPDYAMEDQGEFPAWYINDYVTVSGRTILEEFHDKRAQYLSKDERALLEAHGKSYSGIYEVLEVRPGRGFRLKELITGREIDVEETKASRSLVKWDLCIMRLYRLQEKTRAIGSVQVLGRDLKEELIHFLTSELKRSSKNDGAAEWAAWRKEKPYLVLHFIKNLPEKRPHLVTEEHHPIVISKAHFELRDRKAAVEALNGEYDFSETEAARKGEVKFDWLKRGVSRKWDEAEAAQDLRAVIMKSSLVHPTGKMEWVVLGTITITDKSLVLECVSKDRLTRGKERLKEVLKENIRHKADSFEDLEKALERIEPQDNKTRDEHTPAPDRSFMESLMQKTYRKWVDQRIPALNNMTPREAVRSQGDRGKVVELLKGIENVEERKKRDGLPYVDVNMIREELNLEI